ncbi:MAG: flagellar motor protein MotB [Acidimicrobiia bacterium]|nr:flagellar motor protein MotB [Acidimicrobiia bacterium]
MRKRHAPHHEEDHENHEAWVIPYADMITLLMGLFVVLWAISSADSAKLEAVQTSFAGALGMTPTGEASSGGEGALDGTAGVLEGGPPPAPIIINEVPLSQERAEDAVEALEREESAAEARAAEDEQLVEVEAAINRAAIANGVGDAVQFRREARGLVVSIVSDQVLFEPGSADLRPDGRAVLDGLAGILLALPNPIAIEGHTDDVPISNARFPSNWELSTSRATSVLRHFIGAYGFPADRLTAAGYGEQRPVADNAHPAGRGHNRRVDIAVLSMTNPANVGAPL